MGKTRYIFKKIGANKGMFLARMSTIKVKNGKELTEAEEIKRGGMKTQNYTKKVSMAWITKMVWSFT